MINCLTGERSDGQLLTYEQYTLIRLLSSCGYTADFHRARFPNRMSGCASITISYASDSAGERASGAARRTTFPRLRGRLRQ